MSYRENDQSLLKEFSIAKEVVIKKGMKKNKIRDMAICLSRNHCGITRKELGMYFGSVSGAAITMIYNRIEKEIMQNKRVKGKLNKTKRRTLNI